MIIYLRKMFRHDTDHEISVTKGILKDFFGFSQVDANSKITIVGKNSKMSLEVAFNAPQDPRFGGGLKQIMAQEFDDWSEGDIVLFKKLPQHYLVEVITSEDSRYETFCLLFPRERDRHSVIYLDSDLPSEHTLNHLNNKQVPKIAQNLLIYGVAGVGKSHYIKHTLGINENFAERVVFHPDYSNADFVGQILPTVKVINGEGKSVISYEFKAGAFTKILKRAIVDKSNHYYLIIEEINRGNAPAIFGEIFQLLDRDANGRSQYEISHDLIANYVHSDDNQKIYIPNNLSIYATMNTADQNVFTLDTAFQRRWTMQMIDNNIENCDYRDKPILDTGISWKAFNKVINEHILDMNKDSLSSEDKRLGAFFVRENELANESYFAEKVIKYLWDDVFKFNKSALFNSSFNSLDKVLSAFKSNKDFQRFDIFNEDIKLQLEKLKSNQESTVSLENSIKNE